VNRYEGYPGVELVGQAHQVVRVGVEGLDEDSEEADEDGELDYEGSQASQGGDPGLPVHLHGLLRDTGSVAAVTLLNLPHFGLEQGHGPHLADLLQGQGQGYHPYQHRERNDGDAHVVKEDDVQHHQGVEHGPDYDLIPEEDDYVHEASFLSLAVSTSCISHF
jgi:hypothetical protein